VSDGIKMAKRVLLLSNTIFANNDLAKNKIKSIVDFYFSRALKLMFGVKGKFIKKINCIIENLPRQQDSKYFLVRFTQKSTSIFSLFTICGFPFYC
jgi:hypothetical protein